MNKSIPEHWIEITEAQMQSLLDCCQYLASGFYNGIFFYHRHNGKDFAAKLDNGKFWCDPNERDLPYEKT